jgi:hypothetical protein
VTYNCVQTGHALTAYVEFHRFALRDVAQFETVPRRFQSYTKYLYKGRIAFSFHYCIHDKDYRIGATAPNKSAFRAICSPINMLDIHKTVLLGAVSQYRRRSQNACGPEQQRQQTADQRHSP